MQDLDVFSTIEDWLQVVALHLILTSCIEAMKIALYLSHPKVALLTRGAAGITWTMDIMLTGSILYTCVLAVATSRVLHHKSKVTL